MSTLKTIYLQHLNGANNNAVLDTAGNMAVTGTVYGGSSMVNRNRLINGDMRIDQRFSGAANTLSFGVQYVLDRWSMQNITGGTFTVQQMNAANTAASNYEAGSAPAGFLNSVKMTVGTANTSPAATSSTGLGQAIEGLNVADLGWGTSSAKTVTVSFWAKSNITGQFALVIYNYDGSRVYATSTSITAANTWEYKTLTIPGDTTGTWPTSNGIGMWFKIYLSLGSPYLTSTPGWNSSSYYGITGQTNWMANVGNNFYITGVQLEVGTVATPFEYRQYGSELALCQRYFQRYTAPPLRGVFQGASSLNRIGMSLPVEMRIAPTPTITTSLNWYDGGATGTITSFSQDYSTTRTVEYDAVPSSGSATGGRPCIIYNSAPGYLSLSAEL